jgi:hypothetical protein
MLQINMMEMEGLVKLHKKWILAVLMTCFVVSLASAQVLTADQLKRAVPSSYFFAGQSAPVQMRNAAGFKNDSGKLVLVALVDTSGYATAIAEKYQGLLITEGKIDIEGSALEPGAYGFGFKDGKFTVMNVAASDVVSVDAKSDDKMAHAVPLKIEKEGDGYTLYAGKKYVTIK